MAVVQLGPAVATPVAYLVTVLLATLFYAITLHIAARYVLGDVPLKRAFLVAPLLAVFSFALQQAGPAITAAVTVVVAYVAIHVVYDLSHKLTLLVAVVYYTVALLLGLVVVNLVALFGEAPI